MGFNYGREKRRFDKEWEQLQKEYADAGMDEADIAQMKEFDWKWFCSRRVYDSHNQALPDEENIDEGRTILFRKFPELSADFKQQEFSDRYAWMQEIEDRKLYQRLCRLGEKDLELLTLMVVDGYRQVDIARQWGCTQNSVTKRLNRIKKVLSKGQKN